MPLYGFLEGDTIGLLVLAMPEDTVAAIGEKLKKAASVRVRPREGGQVYFEGQVLDGRLKLGQSGLAPLDRIDVRWEP